MPTLSKLPACAGVGFKPQHFTDILSGEQPIGFVEVHAENYMGAGGPPHAQLTALRERYALSVHGVGLSIGGAAPLNGDHLARLKLLCDRYQPDSFSEHLAWSSHGEVFYNDLLPLPYTAESLARIVEHIDQVQNTLGREMLLENPSTYVTFTDSTFAETEFLAEIARRSGCGLLLDVNNVQVSSVNLETDAIAYLDAFPVRHVGEIHLAGYAPEDDGKGNPLLIAAHDRPIDPYVWSLYEHTIARTGPVPTLIEWDNDVPEWPVLFAEAKRADAVLAAAAKKEKTLAFAG